MREKNLKKREKYAQKNVDNTSFVSIRRKHKMSNRENIEISQARAA